MEYWAITAEIILGFAIGLWAFHIVRRLRAIELKVVTVMAMLSEMTSRKKAGAVTEAVASLVEVAKDNVRRKAKNE